MRVELKKPIPNPLRKPNLEIGSVVEIADDHGSEWIAEGIAVAIADDDPREPVLRVVR